MKFYSTYIFCTPSVHETPLAFSIEVAQLLDGVKSNHSFYGCGVVSDEIIKDKKDDFNSIYRKIRMPDFFELCKKIRTEVKEIPDNSFVVILTDKDNDQKYFSASDGRNIYINVKDLERYSLNQSVYPIAFQILENIFQSICGIVYHEDKIDERLHVKSEGCINDLCRVKANIINKLKNATICEKCKAVAFSDKRMSEYELELFHEMFTSIKTPLLIKFEQHKKDDKPIKIDKSGNITINGNLLEIENIQRAIYLFFLINGKGMTLEQLGNHVHDLALLYQKIRNKGKSISTLSEVNIDKIKSIVVSGRHNQFDPTFYRKVSEINSTLKKQLEPTIVEAFLLKKDENGVYGLKIDTSKIEVSPELIIK